MEPIYSKEIRNPDGYGGSIVRSICKCERGYQVCFTVYTRFGVGTYSRLFDNWKEARDSYSSIGYTKNGDLKAVW